MHWSTIFHSDKYVVSAAQCACKNARWFQCSVHYSYQLLMETKICELISVKVLTTHLHKNLTCTHVIFQLLPIDR